MPKLSMTKRSPNEAVRWSQKYMSSGGERENMRSPRTCSSHSEGFSRRKYILHMPMEQAIAVSAGATVDAGLRAG